MTPLTRVRRAMPLVLVTALALVLGACGGDYPNSTFNHHTDLNTDIDALWDKLLFWGTLVFVIVEAILIYTIVKFRKRPNSPAPQMTHGNTVMEITWTVVPILILVVIAIPTVKTIFKTQATAAQGSLEIEVIGHQWWWEYKYPQYKFSTANEFYIPTGRTVNFTLKTVDVLHAFWVPQMGGKRDLIRNHTNHLWYTAHDSVAGRVWNGFCTEYCGASHANMRIRAFTVTPAEFDQWVAGQKQTAFAVAPPAADSAAPAGRGGMASAALADGRTLSASAGDVATPQGNAAPPASKQGGNAAQTAAAPPPVPARIEPWFYPAEKLPDYAKAHTPIPNGLSFDDNLLAQGDASRGAALFVAKARCGECHTLSTSPALVAMMLSTQGPNLTHIATRHTIAAGLFPNDPQHMARWIKNARKMKPGVIMYTLGQGEIDPQTGKPTTTGNLTDHEIADIVAYLQKLK